MKEEILWQLDAKRREMLHEDNWTSLERRERSSGVPHKALYYFHCLRRIWLNRENIRKTNILFTNRII